MSTPTPDTPAPAEPPQYAALPEGYFDLPEEQKREVVRGLMGLVPPPS